jgi:hypothetical protein
MSAYEQREAENLRKYNGAPPYSYRLQMEILVTGNEPDMESLYITRAEYIQLKRHLVRMRVAAALRDTAEAIEDGQAEPGEAVSLYAQDSRETFGIEDDEPAEKCTCGLGDGKHHPDCPCWDAHSDNYEEQPAETAAAV